MPRVDLEDLKNLDSVEDLTEIFTSLLNYQYQASLISTRRWKEDIANSILESEIKLLAKHEDFHIVYCKIESLRLGIERPIVNQLLKEHPYLLVIFSDKSNQNWHFVNIKYDEEIKNRRLFRRIVIGPYERLHTAAERINKLEITDDSIGSIEVQNKHDDAFDVEEVTKAFYDRFAEMFKILADDIAEENPQIDTFKEAQVILNRLIFLYFIQKKGWLNNNKTYLYENFLKYHKKDLKGNSFYSEFLVRLFQALSCPGNLHKSLLGDVPFLNGGLFEVNPFPVHPKLQPRLIIRNSTFKPIFDELLEHFNFTVREDTPLDVEVAIDPEMLGKIFENLVLRLERGEDLRKKTGSYYTPRVIVHFMCQEALKEYLVTESEIGRSKIELLFKMNPADQLTEEEIKSLEDSFIIPQARHIKNLIKKAYILDPAVGSGAFLVGMLHEMLSAIKLLDVRESGIKHIQKINYDYELKRQLIETSLYGVDIQEQAVRICELRLWLSLIVDYEKVKAEEVPPLPNLSYRIRCGDSLIEKLFGHNVQLDQLVQTDKGKQLIDEITKDKEAYFLERNIKEKNRIELSALHKQCELMELLIKEKQKSLEGPQLSLFGETAKEREERGEFEETKKEYERLLSQAANTRQKVAAILKGKISIPAEDIHNLKKKLGISFIWKLDFAEAFKEKGGFDVVMENPPYGAVLDTVAELIHKLYPRSTQKHKDSYKNFIDLSLSLLKKGGVYSFITPNTFISQSRYEDIRIILKETTPRYIINLGESIFEESIVPVAISIGLKDNCHDGDTEMLCCDISYTKDPKYKERAMMFLPFVKNTFFSVFGKIKDNLQLINASQKTKKPFLAKDFLDFKDAGINYQRVGVGMGEKGKSDLANRLLHEGIQQKKQDKMYWKGSDINRYWIAELTNRWCRPNYKDFIQKNEVVRLNKEIYDTVPKILIRQTADRIIACIDNKGVWFGRSIIAAIPKRELEKEDMLILAILNSKYITWLYRQAVGEIGRVFAQVKKAKLEELPFPNIKNIEKKQKDKIAQLVKKIIDYKKSANNPDEFDRLDTQIDQKVYELYGLTEEEIKIVESSL